MSRRYRPRVALALGRRLGVDKFVFYPARECENELETTPTPSDPVGVMKPRLAHFTIELNDSGWISEMVRWKATSKGFLTGHLQEPSEVIKPNRELRKVAVVCLKMEFVSS